MRITRAILVLAGLLAVVIVAARLDWVGRSGFESPIAGLSVPEGFEVERIAGPPLVERPIVADFDEAGRLYVAESSGSNDKVQKQLAEKPHRILRLEDVDGDGRFDRRTVFADRMMLPEGAMWLDGSLYVSAPPSIWKLTDTDGDGVADRREEWFQGKTLTNCANDLHGPYAGLDGWIYWAKGAFAEQTYERAGKAPLVTRAAHIFRRHPDGWGTEPVMTGGMDNPVDVVFTPEGERIFSATFLEHPQLGRRDALVHAIYGGIYGKEHAVIESAAHKKTGELMPVLTHFGPAAPCGLTTYTSQVFGAGYRDNLFTALFNLHKVTRHELRPSGATFASRDSDFLVSSSLDFHPTDVLEDADGSLVVIDTGGWYKLCCPTSQLAKADVPGAIYRVQRKGAASPPDPRGLTIDWTGAQPAALAQLLDDPRPAVRTRAIRRLARGGDHSLEALVDVLTRPGSREARRNAVWTLTRIETEAARAAVRVALADADDSVRQAAVHSVGLRRDTGAVAPLVEALGSGAPQLRRAAAEALGRMGDRRAVPSLLDASAAAGGDRALEHSLVYALIEIADPAGTAAGLRAASSETRRAAMIALDQMDGGGLRAEVVTPLLGAADPTLDATAWWIAGRHPEWGRDLAGFFARRLADSTLDAAGRDTLSDQLVKLNRNSAIQELLASTAARGASNKDTRLTALRAMGRGGLKELPPAWGAALVRVLAERDPDLLRGAVAAARASAPPKDGTPGLSAALIVVARASAAPADVRVEALAAVPGGLTSVEPDLFDFLRASVAPEQSVAVRTASAGVLGRAKLGRAQLLELTGVLAKAGPMELSQLLPAFDGANDEELGLRMIAALRQSKARISLRPDLVKARLVRYPESVRREGEALLASLDVDVAKQKVRLDELQGTLQGGDVRHGQLVFNSQKAACYTCHAIGYLGGRVGPDLTRIGQVRSERDLLESLIYPNASFVRSYEPMVVVTRSGETHSGVLRRDAPDEVVVATSATDEARIPRSDVAELRPGTVSLMPSGLDQQLSRQELADLLAFLKATRWGAK